MEVEEIIEKLKEVADPIVVERMTRFGINPKNTLGVRVPYLRKIARQIGKDTSLAKRLWKTKIHEARILASMVADPNEFSEKDMESWVRDFDSWDICDQCCMNLFDKTDIAFEKAVEWAEREEEFVRRAGFALMACLAWHRKEIPDKKFLRFFPLIEKYSVDKRNFVRKAVNWALRQIGKKSEFLKKKAIEVAERMLIMNSKTSHWVARSALKELRR